MKNIRLAARGESKVEQAISAHGIEVCAGGHNDSFDLIATTPGGVVKIEVKTSRYLGGMYRFNIRKSTADYVVLACVDRAWWYVVIPGHHLSGVSGFSIRSRKPDHYRGKFKDMIGRFDLVNQKLEAV